MLKLPLLKKLSTIWLTAIALSGCGHVTVYDKEVCGDLGQIGAHCAHTLTPVTRDIPKAQWDNDRVGWLCTNSTGYNDTETSIDQLCTTTKLCDYKMRQQLTLALKRIRRVAVRAQRARTDYRAKMLANGIDIDAPPGP